MIPIKEYVANKKEDLKKLITDNMKLAIVQVGNVEASNRYVKNKLKDCEEVGLAANLLHFNEDISEQELLERAEADRDGGLACNDESQILNAQHRTLWLGLRVLHALHFSHPSLSRHDGAPFADQISGWCPFG